MRSTALALGSVVALATCSSPRDRDARATSSSLDPCGAPATAIWAVQGDGPRTPLEGRTVTVEGIVVGDYEGAAPALRGFYLQSEGGDDDPATSDAVFVFNGDRDDVASGDRVRVRGRAEEFHGQTQISRSGPLEVCARGRSLEPVDVTLPFLPSAGPERYEGMLVRFPQGLHVTDTHGLGRFGEVVLTSGERLIQPTDVAAPGPAARAVQDANERDRVLLDDATNAQNPDPIPWARGGRPLSADNTLRGGDAVAGLVGILTWTWAGDPASGNAWRVRPVDPSLAPAPVFRAGGPRPAPPDPGGSTRVASFNVLNYFDTFAGCTAGRGGAPVDCRGAPDAEAFGRQWRKTVAALVALDADIVGLLELENDGYGPDSAIGHLVARLNAATAPGRWSFVDVDAATGRRNALGADAIKVGLLYRSDRVRPVGTTAVLDTRAFVTGGDGGVVGDGEVRNRPSLAQAFETAGGGRLVVDVNHLKSKGSPCDAPDAGDGQGNCNAVRTTAARTLAAWLATDPTGTGDPDVLVLGDLNAYTREDPVRALEAAGYTSLLRTRIGPGAYTYVFDGQWGSLDHALATPSLAAQVTGVAVWHVNADEPPVLDYTTRFKSPGQQVSLYAPGPFRSSDHDPVVVGLALRPE